MWFSGVLVQLMSSSFEVYGWSLYLPFIQPYPRSLWPVSHVAHYHFPLLLPLRPHFPYLYCPPSTSTSRFPFFLLFLLLSLILFPFYTLTPSCPHSTFYPRSTSALLPFLFVLLSLFFFSFPFIFIHPCPLYLTLFYISPNT